MSEPPFRPRPNQMVVIDEEHTMTEDDLAQIEWGPSPGDRLPLARGRRHTHHFDNHMATVGIEGNVAFCACGLTRADYEARQRRGRSSLRAGKDAERAIAKSYGGTRTGQFGGPDDVVVGELFVVQSKAGRGWFREAVWAELRKLTGSQRIPTLIVSDRPGPGRKTRRYVIRTLEDDVALHGTKP